MHLKFMLTITLNLKEIIFNLREIGLFHIVLEDHVFLKAPMIIIIKFGENNVLWQYILIWGFAEGIVGLPYISCFLFIKIEKLQEHDLS